MISKQAEHDEFSNEMFSTMSDFLQSEYSHVQDVTKEVKPEVKTAALSNLVNVLVACAAQLEEVEHPSVHKVDKVLAYISKEMQLSNDK